MSYKYLFIFFTLLIIGCTKPLTSIGDQHITVFNNTNLYFDPAIKSDSIKLLDGFYRMDAGRVLLKKVNIPSYEIQPEVTLNVSLTSNGDPWDKSGSLFIIPATSDLSIIDFEKASFKDILNDNNWGVHSFTHDKKEYKPSVELLRFMTPFGVGFFNNDERVKQLKPVYIPKWEDNVVWQQNITHLLPLLKHEFYVGVFIDTWTKEGYQISADLSFKESNIPNHQKEKTNVIPLVNTIKYSANQKYYDAFNKGTLTVSFTNDTPLKNAKLYYTTTGHGGHSEGDEFTQKENIIKLDNTIIKQFIPWRDDCASFRRFNPSSGVWSSKTMWKGKEIDERIASSDLSRSNWCPGSKVNPEIIEIGNINSGSHQLEISIPKAQAIDGDKINYWMVSAYITYEE
ncbi:peptide-N-glycosidase F-related protein [Tenacibaculum sp. M341]|uniref:peptide-N-glycosidase F-related protein n=1 Tax=Tenacibaculum sp. M341 TaxID=2530339 RepID=UPI001051E011|nr:PNGase F N-terminal domain-containing protein [Tenacibaculum sp. M341]TCI94178.1 N-glycanase [Tenacibaculum sp. M341]